MDNEIKTYYTKEEIFDLFNSFPEIEDSEIKNLLLEAMSFINTNIIDNIESRVIFISADKSIFGMYINHLSKRYIKKDFIFLNISRFKNCKKKIKIIMHEIAHSYYKHKCYIYDFSKSKEYDKNEQEANILANEWYNNYINSRKQ